MKIIRNILLYLCLLSWFSNYAVASSTDNDSCTSGQSILARMLSTITTFGLFAAYSENFYIDGAPSDTTKCSADYYPASCSGSSCSGSGVMHDAKGCTTCPINGSSSTSQCSGQCNISDPTGCANGATCSSNCDPGGGINVCYKYASGIDENGIAYTWDCNWVRNGWDKLYLIPPAHLKVVQMGDKLCAQFWTVMGFQSIGCKYLPDCSQFSTSTNCYVSQACGDDAFKNSRSLFPITAAIMQCIKDSISYLFVNQQECGSTTNYVTSYFPQFQNAMRKAIKAAITLYFIIFGIKMCMGGEMPSKGEFFTFAGKYILVMYFSVGFFTHYDGYGNPVYDDGITTYMLPLFQDGATDLANIVYTAGGVRGLCDYTQVEYNSGYQYLSMWDAIDCRILYYLGLDLSRLANVTEVAGVSALLALLGAPVLFAIIIPAILSFQLVFAVFLVIFAIFMMSIMVYFVNIIVLCTIAIAILIYMAPIFVPMALFAPTKGYYEGWLKLLISYALQPMVVAAYMALMMTIFDQTIFGDCYFENRSISFTIGTVQKDLPFFMLCDPHASGSSCSSYADASLTECSKTIGYQANPIRSDQSLTQTISALFFDITVVKPSVAEDMLSGLITLCLFGFLFYKFAAVLSDFAAELTGGTAIGHMAGNPMALVDKAAKVASMAVTAAKAYVKSKMGDKKGSMEDMKKLAEQSGVNVSSMMSGGAGADKARTTPDTTGINIK